MKFCGKRGSQRVYFKEELIRLAVERLGLEEKSMRSKTKDELCRLLGIEEIKKTPLVVHTEKVCSDKKTKAFPNRYSKEELIELIVGRKLSRIPKAALAKLSIVRLCGMARLPFTDIPSSSQKKKAKKREVGFIVKSKDKEEGIEETKETADCVTRGTKRPFKHQLRVLEHFRQHRGLVAVHSVGSGKTLTAVLASQCYLDENPRHKVIVVSPTTLIENFKKEMIKYGDIRHGDRYEFYSFQGFYYKHKKSPPNCKNTFLIVDEAHNLRTQYKKTPKKEIGKFTKTVVQCAKKADRVLLLTATPIVNKPGDVASLLDMIRDPRDKKELKSSDVEKNQEDEAFVRQIALSKFSFYSVDRETAELKYPRKKDISIYLPMGKQFQEAYNKVENVVMEDEVVMNTFGEAQLKKFFNGIRRAVNILSGLPEDELVKSPKVKWIIDEIKKNPKKKTVVFSHFLDMGLKAIQKRLPPNIRSDYITGSKSKTKRAQIVKDYNNDKIDVLFISKAGGEGIDLKGTRRIFLLESGWNENTEEQVIGRGIRYESHDHLPPEERLVEVYHLYHIKPEERQQVLDLMRQRQVKNPTDVEIFDKYMKKLLDEYNYKQSLEDPDTWLSADLMLRKISLEKQKKIDAFLDKLQKLSIEKQEERHKTSPITPPQEPPKKHTVQELYSQVLQKLNKAKTATDILNELKGFHKSLKGAKNSDFNVEEIQKYLDAPNIKRVLSKDKTKSDEIKQYQGLIKLILLKMKMEYLLLNPENKPQRQINEQALKIRYGANDVARTFLVLEKNSQATEILKQIQTIYKARKQNSNKK